MKITLESTSKVVLLNYVGREGVPARIWEGVTDKGVKCHAFITRIAVHVDDDAAEFERDLAEQRKPISADIEAYPLRMIL